MASKALTHRKGKVLTQRPSSRSPVLRALAPIPKQTHSADIIRRATSDFGLLTPGDVLQLHRTIGNRAVVQLLAGTLRRKTVHEPESGPMEQISDGNFSVRIHTDEQSPGAKRPLQVKENKTGLPDNLKAGIESLAGGSMDDVRVHYNSSAPAQLNALAYTRGAHIYVGPGQESHIPHEAWHVVQQRQGRVRPTLQTRDVAINDDEGLEGEADVMGARANSSQSRTPQPAKPDSELLSPGSRGEDELLAHQLTHGVEPNRSTLDHAANAAEQPEQTGSSHEGTPTTIQRSVGFEVELSVPTFSPAPGVADPRILPGPDGDLPSPKIDQFLSHGLPYGRTNLGTNPDFRLTADHNVLATKGLEIFNALMGIGRITEAFGETNSNLEYSTKELDELAPKSTAGFKKQITAITSHVKSVYPAADHDMIAVPDTAAVFAGFPNPEFKTWLKGDYVKIVPHLKSFWESIDDNLYVQATAGIIPSAIPELFGKLEEEDSLFKGANIGAAVRSRVEELFKHKEFLEHIDYSLLEEQGHPTLKGVLYLLFSYMVGNAIYHTTAISDNSTSKNAVAFLSQMKLGDIKNAAAPLEIGKLFGPSRKFSKIISDFLIASPFVTAKYWVDTYGVEERPARENIFGGPMNTIVSRVLAGEDVGTVSPHALAGDTQQKVVEKASGGEKGIPLEYRLIKERPKPDELEGLLLKIVNQVRDLNTKHLDAEKKKLLIDAANAI